MKEAPEIENIPTGDLNLLLSLSETIQNFFYGCPYSILFWKDFESYYLALTKQQTHLNLKDVIVGVLTAERPLLNYLLLVRKTEFTYGGAEEIMNFKIQLYKRL